MIGVRARVFVLLAACSLQGCTRKAPSPLECERAAYALAGVSDRRMLQSPEVKSVVDDITVECLTTPYDRALLDCFEQTGAANACYGQFRLRHGGPRLAAPVRQRRALPWAR